MASGEGEGRSRAGELHGSESTGSVMMCFTYRHEDPVNDQMQCTGTIKLLWWLQGGRSFDEKLLGTRLTYYGDKGKWC